MSISKNKAWVNTARVRATQFARGKYSKDYASQEVALTKSYGCNALLFFLEMDGWTLYPSKHAEMDFTIGKHDLLGQLRNECQKQNVRLIAAFMGLHCQTYHFRKHPDWTMKHHSSVFADSPFAGHNRNCFEKDVMCLHSPFRQIMFGQVEEVLKKYQPDGIYFDGIYSPPGYDYSDWAQEKFRQRFGRDVPKDSNDPDWLKWHASQCPDFAREMRQLIDQTYPQALLFLDNHGPTIGTYDADENAAGEAEFVNVCLQEAYFECSGESPRFIAQEALLLAAETQLPVWGARWATRGPGHLHVPIPETTAMTWLCDAVSVGAAPVIVDQEGFWYNRTLQKPFKKSLTKAGKLRRLLGETEPLSYVALFHSAIRKQERMHENLMAVRAPFEGMFQILEQAHIPFTIVTERDILQDKLKNFESLVIPGTECISDSVAEKISSFVTQGGGIVSTFRTSFKDDLGKERKIPALADIFGIKNITGGRRCCATYDGYDYGWPSINVPANLFKVTKGHPVTRELLMDCLYAYAGGLIYAKMTTDSDPLLHTILYDDKLAHSGRFFRYMPEEKLAQPLAFVRRHGKGRVVWFAGDIDRSVWEMGNPECAQLIKNAVNWVTTRKSPITCNAPELVAMRARRNPKTQAMQISLTNYAQSQIFSPGFPGIFDQNAPMLKEAVRRRQWPEHVSPVTDIKIQLDWPSRKMPVVETLMGTEPKLRRANGKIEITIPKIEEGEVIALLPV